MGLFFGPRRGAQDPAQEERSVFAPVMNPWAIGRDFSSINATLGETSLQSVAVRSTVDLIASLASELPVAVYTDGSDGKARKLSVPSNVLDPDGTGVGVEDWVYRLLMSWLMRGNAYGFEVEWDRRGKPTLLDIVNPDNVSATMDAGRPVWTVSGKQLEPEDAATFVHHRVNPLPGRVLGLSPIAAHATTIGISLTSAMFGNQWFTDGAHPTSMLTNSEGLNETQADIAKQRFMAAMRGRREPLVLGKGWEYSALQINPDESQFLETQGFTEAQCARIYGPGFAEVLGYETGGSMTYANVVDRRQDLLVFSMNRWIRRAERVLSTLLPPKQYVRLNRDALLEATTLQRYQAHGLALDKKWKTINEVRDHEDMDAVPWGDEPVDTNENNKEVPDGSAA